MVTTGDDRRAVAVLASLFARTAELRLPNLKTAGLEVFAQTRDYSCRVLAGRVKRALRSNRDFHSVEGEQARGHAVTQLSADDLRRLVDDPSGCFVITGTSRSS